MARKSAAAFGLLTLAVALSPAFDARADESLTAHMLQHVLLLMIAPPLVVLALPDRWRGTGLRGIAWLAVVGAAMLLQSLAMTLWHVPAAYEQAERHIPVHVLEHGSFLGTASFFWWTVMAGRRSALGRGVVVLFVAALPGTALGAAMTLAAHPWYRSYRSLEDQQLAGVVMWAFGGLVYVVAAAVLFAAWLSALERTTPGRVTVAEVPS